MPLARRGPGLIGTAARTAVFAGTATAVSGRVARRQQQRWADEDAAAYEQQAPPPAAAAPPPAAPAGEPDYMAELQQLAQLRDQGILTPEEFEAKKKQLLGI
jgi:Short C-terminal domain